MKLKHLFESEFLTSKEEVEKFLDNFGIRNYTIHDNLIVDVNGSVDISYARLAVIPVKFGTVSDSFICSSNRLTSLIGSPREVGRDFNCRYNNLTSLAGAPREVGGNFYCAYNKLTSLKGSPQAVGGDFGCSFNELTSLKGAP